MTLRIAILYEDKDIYVEFAPLNSFLNLTTYQDSFFGGMNPVDINPAVPTSGTVTSYLGIMTTGVVQGTILGNLRGDINAVLNI